MKTGFARTAALTACLAASMAISANTRLGNTVYMNPGGAFASAHENDTMEISERTPRTAIKGCSASDPAGMDTPAGSWVAVKGCTTNVPVGVDTPAGDWVAITMRSMIGVRTPNPDEIASLVKNADGQIRSFDLMVNAPQSMAFQRWTHPCEKIGIGLIGYHQIVSDGIARGILDDTPAAPIGWPAVSGTAIGYQEMAGGDAPLTDCTSARLGHRYFETGRPDIDATERRAHNIRA